MAIWPLLYLKEEWCESNISGQVYTLSFLPEVVTLSFLPEVVTQCPFEIQLEKESSTSRQLLSYIFSQDSRLSAKHMFRCKIQSEIMDFANNFEILSFQFDLWLYKTVSGLQLKLELFINLLNFLYYYQYSKPSTRKPYFLTLINYKP